MPEIKRLSPRHDAIMEWLIANPELPKAECARVFGVTQAWLSTIIHSDAFQSKYRALLEERMETRIMPLRDKLVGLVDASVEKLMLQAEVNSDPAFHLAIVDKIGKRLPAVHGGEQPRGGVSVQRNTQMNFFSSVSGEELEKARRAYREAQIAALPAPEVGSE